MEQNHDPFAPEAATDEALLSNVERPASPSDPTAEDEGPVFATEAEQAAYWRGVTQGIRDAGREPGHPHMPVDFDLSLTRDGAAPGLTSARLLDAWPHNPHDANPPLPDDPAIRHDGWDPVKERIFHTTLAETGVVADACRACGMSRNAAYARRRGAAGRAFALGWDAAILIARGAVADDVISRARHGVIDRVYKNGELVAERHRYDNRLTMSVLTRLDRLAEGLGENAPVIRAVAQEFDRFLDLLPEGVAGAETFVAARFPTPTSEGDPRQAEEPPSLHGEIPAPDTERALLARLCAYRDYGVGLPAEIDLDALDSGRMESWTDDEWARAAFSGLLDMMPARDWPESARDPGQDGSDGMCHLRHLYLRYHPAPAGPEPMRGDDFAGCGVWEGDDGAWMTDFPPPRGFDGYEEGEAGEDDYRRALTQGELAAIGAGEEAEAARRAERLAEEHDARRRFFGLDGDDDAGGE
ncbi:MAG TPA: hypothetical protein VMS43_11310 [Allosphingosinicella sp.]|nr:hypothetical protein [Allosphingosinicella sp.]